MKVAIFGATGATGLEICRAALEAGHELNAYVRDPARMPLQHGRLRLCVGELGDQAAIEEAVRDRDAVVCALGSRELGPTRVRRDGTAAIISAMASTGRRRLVVISAMGVGDSWRSLSLLNRAFFALLLRSAREDHEAQEAALRGSGLEWTIVRPSGLVDGPATGSYREGEGIRAGSSRIARADLAGLVLRELAEGRWRGRAVTITN